MSHFPAYPADAKFILPPPTSNLIPRYSIINTELEQLANQCLSSSPPATLDLLPLSEERDSSPLSFTRLRPSGRHSRHHQLSLFQNTPRSPTSPMPSSTQSSTPNAPAAQLLQGRNYHCRGPSSCVRFLSERGCTSSIHTANPHTSSQPSDLLLPECLTRG